MLLITSLIKKIKYREAVCDWGRGTRRRPGISRVLYMGWRVHLFSGMPGHGRVRVSELTMLSTVDEITQNLIYFKITHPWRGLDIDTCRDNNDDGHVVTSCRDYGWLSVRADFMSKFSTLLPIKHFWLV